MYREVFDNAMAEMFFIQHAKTFAVMARGCAGMAPTKGLSITSTSASSDKHCRCLYCGKLGHRPDQHANELSEGDVGDTQMQLQKALTHVANDSKLSAELKRNWSTRIKAFWAKIKGGGSVAEATL